MIRLVCLLEDKAGVFGARAIDELTSEVRDISTKEIESLIQSKNCSNATLTDSKITITDGSIASFPSYNKESDTTKNNCMAMVGKLEQGYIMINSLGEVYRLRENEAIILIQNKGCYNAKLVNRGDKVTISAIKGSFKRFKVDNGRLEECTEEATKNKDRFKRAEYKLIGIAEFTGDTIKLAEACITGVVTKVEIPKGYRSLMFVNTSNKCKVMRIAENNGANITLRDVKNMITQLGEVDIDKEEAINSVDKYNKSRELIAKATKVTR